MKKIFFLIAMLICQFVVAQENNLQKTESQNDQNSTIYNSSGIEFKPEYPGGIEKFYDFIGRNYKAPKIDGLSGRVIVSFVVEKDGSLTDIKAIRDIGYGTGEEAIRVLKKSKKWKPGEQNGKKVRVQYLIPISIQAK